MSNQAASKLAAFAAGQRDDAAIAHVARGLRLYFAEAGRMPLERCLGLPSTPRQAAKTRRNFWIVIAHGLCDGDSVWRKSVTLAEESRRFEDTIWREWQYLVDPPPGSSQLRTALFHAWRAAALCGREKNGAPNVPETARQFHRIVTCFDGVLSGVGGQNVSTQTTGD